MTRSRRLRLAVVALSTLAAACSSGPDAAAPVVTDTPITEPRRVVDEARTHEQPLPPPECVTGATSLAATAVAGRGTVHDVLLAGDRAYFATDVALEVYDAADPQGAPLVGWVPLTGTPAALALEQSEVWVAAGAGGVHVVDADELVPTRSKTTVWPALDVSVTPEAAWFAAGEAGLRGLDPASLAPIGGLALPGVAEAIAVGDGFVLVAAGEAGLHVVDIGDPEAPTWLTTLEVAEGQVRDAVVVGPLAYVAAGSAGVRVLDVSVPEDPVVVGSHAEGKWSAQAIGVDGGVAWATNHYSTGLRLLDVSEPAAPELIQDVTTEPFPSAHAFDWERGAMWVASWEYGVRVYDLGDWSLLAAHAPGGEARQVAATGSRAFVADGGGGLRVVDLVDGGPPVLADTIDLGHSVFGVAAEGDLVVAATRDQTVAFATDGRLHVLDVGGEAPVVLGEVFFDGWPNAVRLVPTADGGLVAWVAGIYGGLHAVDLAEPSAPVVSHTSMTYAYVPSVALAGDVGFAATQYQGVAVLDASDPRVPEKVAFVETPGQAWQVATVGDELLLIADGAGGLRVHQIAGTSVPPLVSTLKVGEDVLGVSVAGGQVLVEVPGGLLPVDLGDPLRPRPLAMVPTPGQPGSVVEHEGQLLVADGSHLLSVLELGCVVAVDGSASPAAGVVGEGGASADVRVANLISGPVAVDAEAGGSSVAEALGYGHAAPAAPAQGTLEVSDAVSGEALGEAALVAGTGTVGLWAGADGVEAIAVPLPEAPPEPDAVRVRAAHAGAVEGTLGMSVVRAGGYALLGTLAPGEVGEAVELPAADAASLVVTGEGWTEVLPLPELPGGSEVVAFAARTAEGDSFVLLVPSWGPAVQIGPAGHAIVLRVANLTADAAAVDAVVDGGAASGLAGIAPLTHSALVAVAPGTHVVEAARGGQTAAVTEPFYTARGTTRVAVLHPSDGGGEEQLLLYDALPTGQTGNDTTVVQVVHAAAGLGTVEVRAVRTSGGAQTSKTVAGALEVGDVGSPVSMATGSYRVEVEGAAGAWAFDMGYFPDYGRTLYLARGPSGALRMGVTSNVDAPIWWTPPQSELGSLRVTHMAPAAGAIGVAFEMFTGSVWADDGLPIYGTTSYQKVATGPLAVALGEETIVVDVAPEGSQTLVLLDGGDGGVAWELLDDDAGLHGEMVRLVHASPEDGELDASWADGGAAVPLAAGVAYGEASAPIVASGGIVTIEGAELEPHAFAVAGQASGQVTNLYVIRDETWLHVLAQGAGKQLTPLYSEHHVAQRSPLRCTDRQHEPCAWRTAGVRARTPGAGRAARRHRRATGPAWRRPTR